MSKFFTPTNNGRITKMVDTVGMLAKSAASNKASTEDINTMFEPLIAAMQEMGVEVSYDFDDDQAPAPQAERVAPDGTAREASVNTHAKSEYKPLWKSVQEMAEVAPMVELGQAVIVYAKRIEDSLFTLQDRDPKVVEQNLQAQAELEEDDDDDAWD